MQMPANQILDIDFIDIKQQIAELRQFKPEELAYSNLLAYSALSYPNYIVAKHNTLIAQHLMAVERGEITRLMIFMPPRHGKPQPVDNIVLMADGSRRRLGDIKSGDQVITHRGRPRTVIQVFEQGVLPCVKITTALGRCHKAAFTHPYLTTCGWKQAKDLRSGDILGLVSMPSTEPAATQTDIQFEYMGYMIGDGCCTSAQSFTNGDQEILERFKAVSKRLGYSIREVERKTCTMLYSSGSNCRDWLRKHNLYGKKSREKRVPDFVFKGSKKQIGYFIGAYFCCDGSVNKRGGHRKDCCVEIYSLNKLLLQDIQHLLLRIGVYSYIRI